MSLRINIYLYRRREHTLREMTKSLNTHTHTRNGELAENEKDTHREHMNVIIIINAFPFDMLNRAVRHRQTPNNPIQYACECVFHSSLSVF